MHAEHLDTREALLAAAGELFAEYGFNGASTREIAKQANTNMASIGYHFNGKENLYLESLRSVLDRVCTWGLTLEKALELTQSGMPVAKALQTTLRQRLEEILGGAHPVWETKLIIRALLEPSPMLKALNQERFEPEFRRVVAVVRQWNPQLSEAQAKQWAHSFFGQEIVYVLARSVILDMEGFDAYPPAYLDDVAAYIANLMATALWPEAADGVS